MKTIRSKIDKRAAFWLDCAIRVPLALFFAFSAGVYVKNACERLEKADWSGVHFWPSLIDGFSLIAIALYTFLIASLYVLRLRPKNKFAGTVPTLAALAGGFLISGLFFLKPTALSAGMKLLAGLLIVAGNIFAAYALSHLGRSFSILPESRRLVMSGPYRYIRHPLYLAEAIATTGAVINFLSLPAVALAATQFLLQLMRIHFEERVLRENFPEYRAYSQKTARLMPGLY